MSFPLRTYSLSSVAATGDELTDFRPYVAAMSETGVVAFHADRHQRPGIIVRGDDAIEAGGPVRRFISHPDLTRRGWMSAYAELAAGGQAVVLERGAGLEVLARSGGELAAIGPLGPTMHEDGTVAFRADDAAGDPGVYTAAPDGGVDRVAGAADGFVGFEGLPVIDADKAVVFRARRGDGTEGIYRRAGGVTRAVVETGDRFAELARFPDAGGGAVVFAAVERSGVGGVFVARGGSIEPVVQSGAGFDHVRGALINGAGEVVFFATPSGGELGVYAGPDPQADRVLGFGDPLWDSRVEALVLNPVSMNDRGQLAIRVELAGGAQAIVRADPAHTP